MPENRRFPDPVTAFERGDFTAAYRMAGDSVLGGAALVLLGAFEAGERLIGGADDPRSLFCRALVDWSAGKRADALASLGRIATSHDLAPAAERMVTIIERGKVRVLLQARDDPGLPGYDTAGTMRALDFADVVTVGYPSRSDIAIEDTTTIEDVVARLPANWSPDFYLCSMVEDHPPPLGIGRAPFPTLFSTQDHDRHFHHVRPLMGLFDAGMAFSSVFHEEIEHLTAGGRAFVCPMLMGLDPVAAEAREPEAKTLDLYISGNLFNHSEGKTRNLWRISQLPERYRIALQNSHASPALYLRRLRAAKFTFGYVNNWGVINSRVFEAIAQGTGGFYQEGGELELFLSPNDGAVPYRDDNLEDVIATTLDAFETRFARCARDGAAAARREFDFRRVMRRQLILATAYAALSGIRRGRDSTPRDAALRYPNRSAIRVMYCHDGRIDTLLRRQASFRDRLSGRTDYEARDALGESLLYTHLFNRLVTQKLLDERIQTAEAAGPLAKQMVEAYQGYKEHHASPELTRARELYRNLSVDFPDRIAAHFNSARLAFETGARDEAGEAFRRILTPPALRYEWTDLLFWREFHDESYDYERMAIALRHHAIDHDPHWIADVEDSIRESALYYLCRLVDAGDRAAAEQLLERALPARGLRTLHGLNFEIIRLLALVGRIDEARSYLQRVFGHTPWMMANFGADIVRLMDDHAIAAPEISSAYLRFRARLI